MCLRVYAVTRRNKSLCGALSVLIAAQLSTGIYFAFMYGTGPCELLSRPFVRVLSHRSSVQPPPDVDLDVYKVCFPREQRPAELAFNSISVAFGTPLPSNFQLDFTLGALMSFASRVPLYCRSFYVLNHLGHGQRTRGEWISGRSEHLGCHSTRHDNILPVHGRRSIFALFFLHICPGK